VFEKFAKPTKHEMERSTEGVAKEMPGVRLDKTGKQLDYGGLAIVLKGALQKEILPCSPY
jgi:hypothetical protein